MLFLYIFMLSKAENGQTVTVTACVMAQVL